MYFNHMTCNRLDFSIAFPPPLLPPPPWRGRKPAVGKRAPRWESGHRQPTLPHHKISTDQLVAGQCPGCSTVHHFVLPRSNQQSNLFRCRKENCLPLPKCPVAESTASPHVPPPSHTPPISLPDARQPCQLRPARPWFLKWARVNTIMLWINKILMVLFGLDILVERVAALFWYLSFMRKEKKCFYHLVRSRLSRHILHCTKRPPFPARKIPVKCSTGKIYLGISWPCVPAGNLHMLGRGDCRS